MRLFAVFGALVLIAIVVVLVVVVLLVRHPVPPRQQPLAQALPATANTNLANSASTNTSANAVRSPIKTTEVLPNWSSFKKRPFPVAYQSPHFEWTLADGKDTNIISELAHNQLEYDRMVQENPRIFRRELVYLKVTAASVFEQAKLTGKPVQELTLPGVDGQELQFQITQRDSNGSSRRGMFSGHLVGDLNSMVTMAFMDGREAFTVLAPKENIYVVGEPREPGQVIVKAIDPNTYGVGPMGRADDTIKTGTPNK